MNKTRDNVDWRVRIRMILHIVHTYTYTCIYIYIYTLVFNIQENTREQCLRTLEKTNKKRICKKVWKRPQIRREHRRYISIQRLRPEKIEVPPNDSRSHQVIKAKIYIIVYKIYVINLEGSSTDRDLIGRGVKDYPPSLFGPKDNQRRNYSPETETPRNRNRNSH